MKREAGSSLRMANSLLKLMMETANTMNKDRFVKEAFHASRIASMVHLSTHAKIYCAEGRGEELVSFAEEVVEFVKSLRGKA
jgi:HEPN domain-containing protein